MKMKKNIMNLDESAKTRSKAIELVKRALDDKQFDEDTLIAAMRKWGEAINEEVKLYELCALSLQEKIDSRE